MGTVTYLADAVEDLHRISDQTVVAEIFDLAERELGEVQAGSPIEGLVNGYAGLMWRRAVPRQSLSGFLAYDLDDDTDDFHCQACDYLLVYRQTSSDERIKFQLRRPKYVVVRVLHNRDIARLMAQA